MGVKELLAIYIDRIGDADAVDTIAEVEGVEAAVRAAATIVRDAMGGIGNPNDLSAALTWVRDGSIGVGSEVVKTRLHDDRAPPRWRRQAKSREVVSGLVLERERDARAVRDDLAILDLHVELTDLGDTQVAERLRRRLDR